MYLISGEIAAKDYKMIIKDYYEKFEKLSGRKSSYRNTSIEALQNGVNNFICKIADKNYVTTRDYFEDKNINQFIVALKENTHYIAYAVVNVELFREDYPIYEIDDIIIHDEDKLDDLADGQINIRFNIYKSIIDHLHNTLKNIKDYRIGYNMIDSKDLYDALVFRGYEVDNNLFQDPVEELIKTGRLQMGKAFNLKKEEQDELRLTRKQDKE